MSGLQSSAQPGSGARRLLVPAKADQLKQVRLEDRIDGLRGMAWAFGVLHYTSLTASKASVVFSDYGNPHAQRSNIFYQYLKGDRAPKRGNRGKLGFDLVEAVNVDPSGRHATKWLDHPVWLLFHPATDASQLASYIDEDVLPPGLLHFLYSPKIPSPEVQTEVERERLELQIFDDFVWLCAFYRIWCNGGYRNLSFSLLEYLIPQAAILEPVFGYVQAPFLQMLKDFYYKPDEEIIAMPSKS